MVVKIKSHTDSPGPGTGIGKKAMHNRPQPRRLSPRHRTESRKPGVRWMLMALVLVAVLILLLRLAEFSGPRVRHPRPRMAAAVPMPVNPAADSIINL